MNPFHTSRDIAAEPAAVFAAFKDPSRMARWWGPAGFQNQFDVFDFQPGGQWTFTMLGPDGSRYPNASVFAEIVADHKVVIDHVCDPLFHLTVELQAVPSGTRVLWTQLFADDAVAAAVRSIVEPSNEQNLDRLTQEVLAA